MKYFEREKGDGGKTPNFLDEGFYLISCHQMFGWAPCYRHKDTGEIRYWYGGKICSWNEVAADLREFWRPVATDEVAWFLNNLGKE